MYTKINLKNSGTSICDAVLVAAGNGRRKSRKKLSCRALTITVCSVVLLGWYDKERKNLCFGKTKKD
jgi:hypothetical protein